MFLTEVVGPCLVYQTAGMGLRFTRKFQDVTQMLPDDVHVLLLGPIWNLGSAQDLGFVSLARSSQLPCMPCSRLSDQTTGGAGVGRDGCLGGCGGSFSRCREGFRCPGCSEWQTSERQRGAEL